MSQVKLNFISYEVRLCHNITERISSKMELRNVQYYGLTDTLDGLYQRSTQNVKLNNLLKIVATEKVIRLAIKNISTNGGRNNYGKDWVTFRDFMKENDSKVIKLVKRKILHGQPDSARLVEIPKKSGENRTLGISNIIDRIVEMCFYIILEPIIEGKLSPRTYAFRPNLSTKHAIAPLSSIVWKRSLPMWVVEIDIKDYFDSISIDPLLDKLRHQFLINDPRFLRRIKTIITGLNGNSNIGITQGSILGPILSNVYLHDLDMRLYNYYSDFRKVSKSGKAKFHKLENYCEKHKTLPCHPVRYADNIRLVTFSEELAQRLITFTVDILKQDGLQVSDDKTGYYSLDEYPEIGFVGYTMKKKNDGLVISLTDYYKFLEKVKSAARLGRKFNNYSKFIGIVTIGYNMMNICPNVDHYTKWIDNALNLKKRDGHPIVRNRRVNGVDGYEYWVPSGSKKRPESLLALWTLRKTTRTSISKYLKVPYRNSYRVSEEDNWQDVTKYLTGIDNQNYNSQLVMYLPGILHQQNFKCWVTGQPLVSNEFHIHHKKPLSKGGTNSFKNLVIIDKNVHKELHYSDGSSYNGTSLKRFKTLQDQL